MLRWFGVGANTNNDFSAPEKKRKKKEASPEAPLAKRTSSFNIKNPASAPAASPANAQPVENEHEAEQTEGKKRDSKQAEAKARKQAAKPDLSRLSRQEAVAAAAEALASLKLPHSDIASGGALVTR